MKWTTEKPTQPGWCWVKERRAESEMICPECGNRRSEDDFIVRMTKLYLAGRIRVFGLDETVTSSYFASDAQWAGPIEEPTDE